MKSLRAALGLAAARVGRGDEVIFVEVFEGILFFVLGIADGKFVFAFLLILSPRIFRWGTDGSFRFEGHFKPILQWLTELDTRLVLGLHCRIVVRFEIHGFGKVNSAGSNRSERLLLYGAISIESVFRL